MSKLIMVLKQLIREHEYDGEPATIRLYRGLAIAYREDPDGALLTLSRVGVMPSEREVGIILAIIGKLERAHSEPIVDEPEMMEGKQRKHGIVRVRWQWIDAD